MTPSKAVRASKPPHRKECDPLEDKYKKIGIHAVEAAANYVRRPPVSRVREQVKPGTK